MHRGPCGGNLSLLYTRACEGYRHGAPTPVAAVWLCRHDETERAGARRGGSIRSKKQAVVLAQLEPFLPDEASTSLSRVSAEGMPTGLASVSWVGCCRSTLIGGQPRTGSRQAWSPGGFPFALLPRLSPAPYGFTRSPRKRRCTHSLRNNRSSFSQRWLWVFGAFERVMVVVLSGCTEADACGYTL